MLRRWYSNIPEGPSPRAELIEASFFSSRDPKRSLRSNWYAIWPVPLCAPPSLSLLSSVYIYMKAELKRTKRWTHAVSRDFFQSSTTHTSTINDRRMKIFNPRRSLSRTREQNPSFSVCIRTALYNNLYCILPLITNRL